MIISPSPKNTKVKNEVSIKNGTTPYNPRNNGIKTYKTKSNLIPILAKKDFDDVAQSFLSQFYPEALKDAAPINIDKLIGRMGLTIQEAKLSLDASIYAAVTFGDCSIDVWCSDAGRYKPASFKADSIIIDQTVFSDRNTGRYRNTIIHECVHWFLHRHHYLYKIQRSSFGGGYSKGGYSDDAYSDDAYSNNDCYLKCTEGKGKTNLNKWSDLDWMEWQANGIAPRILMPTQQTQKVVERVCNWYYPYLSRYSEEVINRIIVGTVASCFGVSFQMAKIRMLDLGYKAYEGVMPYVNDSYINSYHFKPISKSDNQTFSISKEDVIRQYSTNKDFRDVLDSGKFIYIDGFVVLANSKYVMKNIYDEPVLTRYATENIDECCLRFDLVINVDYGRNSDTNSCAIQTHPIQTSSTIQVNPIQTHPNKHHNHAIFKDTTINTKRTPFFNKDKHNMELFSKSEEMKSYYYEIASEISFAFETEQTFSQQAWKFIRKKGLNRQVFQDKTLLSSTMYDRIRNNDFEANPKIETVMSLCIGLSLSGSQAEQLLEKAGHKLNDSPLHIVYRSFLNTLRGRSIYEYNEILKGFGMPLLSNKAYVNNQ